MATKRSRTAGKKKTGKKGTSKSTSKRGAKKKAGKRVTVKKTAKKPTRKATKSTKKKKTTGKKASGKTGKKTPARKSTGSRVKKAAKTAKTKAAKKASTARKRPSNGKPVSKAASRPRRASRQKLDTIRDALLLKKEALTRHLQSELSGLETADKHHLADLEEMASDTQDTDSVCEIMEVGANTLEQVEQALTKLDQGTYGRCEDCDGDIPFERLEALPFATLCVSCKRKRELARPF